MAERGARSFAGAGRSARLRVAASGAGSMPIDAMTAR
jgi:hypothetical protein